VHNHNIDDVEEIFAWCAENNYPRPQWLETHAIGRALMHPEMLIPHSEVNRVFEIYKRCMDRYASQLQEEGEEVMAPAEAVAEVRSIDTIKFCQRLEQATNMEKCGRSTVYFNSAGEVFPCSNCMSNRSYRAGSLREKNFQEIWDNGFEEFRKITFSDFNACSTCRVQEAGIWCQFRCPPLSQNISKSATHCGATAYLKDFMIRSTLYWRERQARGIHLLMVAHNKKNVSTASSTGVNL
jgi:radical SAM protein with 4Fe4S-binding SPASM domain